MNTFMSAAANLKEQKAEIEKLKGTELGDAIDFFSSIDFTPVVVKRRFSLLFRIYFKFVRNKDKLQLWEQVNKRRAVLFYPPPSNFTYPADAHINYSDIKITFDYIGLESYAMYLVRNGISVATLNPNILISGIIKVSSKSGNDKHPTCTLWIDADRNNVNAPFRDIMQKVDKWDVDFKKINDIGIFRYLANANSKQVKK